MAVGRRDCDKYSKRDLLLETGGTGERTSSPSPCPPAPLPPHTWLRLSSGYGAAALVSGWKTLQGEPREQANPRAGHVGEGNPLCMWPTQILAVCTWDRPKVWVRIEVRLKPLSLWSCPWNSETDTKITTEDSNCGQKHHPPETSHSLWLEPRTVKCS